MEENAKRRKVGEKKEIKSRERTYLTKWGVLETEFPQNSLTK
jgi:hypothetical protein